MRDAIAGIKESGFGLGDDLEYKDSPEHKWIDHTGTVTCAGEIRVCIEERFAILRRRPWLRTLKRAKLRLLTYSYSAVLQGRGTIFRYDSPDAKPSEGAPEHHRFHHLHRFDVLGTGEELAPVVQIKERDIPSLRQVLQEAEGWYFKHLAGR